MLDVLMDMAGTANVLHQIHAIRFQGPMNALKHIERFTLIVYGIEGRDEVEECGLIPVRG
jgi:hypothetical protein